MATIESRPGLVGLYNQVRTAKNDRIQAETTAAVTAKVATASDPGLSAGVSLIASVQKQDAVQASADALKLSAASVAKVMPTALPVANNLIATASAITSVNKAVQGDAYLAASAAATAIEKASPALAQSAVAAVANAFVLGSVEGKIAEQKKAVNQSAKQVLDPHVSTKQRLTATLDLTTALQGLVNFYRSAGNAVWKIGTYAIGRAAKVRALAPAAAKAETSVAKLVASPVGKTVAVINKWMPLLNLASVALATKTAVNVFHDPNASDTTKSLSIASVGTATAGLIAGLAFGGWPLFATVVAGIVTDIALACARQSDAHGEDTDARARYLATHPHVAVGEFFGWCGRTIPALCKEVWTQVKHGWSKITGLFRPAEKSAA